MFEEFCASAIAYLKVAEPKAESDVVLTHADSPVLRNFGNGLLVSYVVDVEDQLQYVQHRHLEAASMTEEQLHKHAIANLTNLSGEKVRIQPYGNIFAIFFDGSFEASLLLADKFWDIGIAHLAPNGFVAAIPARDILAVCDASSTEGIEELGALIVRTQGGDHLLSTILWRRVEDHWVPLVN